MLYFGNQVIYLFVANGFQKAHNCNYGIFRLCLSKSKCTSFYFYIRYAESGRSYGNKLRVQRSVYLSYCRPQRVYLSYPKALLFCTLHPFWHSKVGKCGYWAKLKRFNGLLCILGFKITSSANREKPLSTKSSFNEVALGQHNTKFVLSTS